MPHTYKYPRPAVTVDLAIFTVKECKLHMLLIERGGDPFKGCWACPGGFVNMDETVEAAAARELKEETGLGIEFGQTVAHYVYLRQLGVFSEPQRDPRQRTITVAFTALIPWEGAMKARAGSDAARAEWFPVYPIGRGPARWPELAFDHYEIMMKATGRVRKDVFNPDVAQFLLPDKFSLTELQSVYEAVLCRSLDARNFRKKMKAMGFIRPIKQLKTGKHRPARMYEFEPRREDRVDF